MGIGLPVAFNALWVSSCPHEYGMIFVPLISAECVGEFIGQLGFFLTAMPALGVGLCLISFMVPLVGVIEESPPLIHLSPTQADYALLSTAALINLVFYWIVIYRVFRRRSKSLSE
jgi:hypothetical protein